MSFSFESKLQTFICLWFCQSHPEYSVFLQDYFLFLIDSSGNTFPIKYTGLSSELICKMVFIIHCLTPLMHYNRLEKNNSPYQKLWQLGLIEFSFQQFHTFFLIIVPRTLLRIHSLLLWEFPYCLFWKERAVLLPCLLCFFLMNCSVFFARHSSYASKRSPGGMSSVRWHAAL